MRTRPWFIMMLFVIGLALGYGSGKGLVELSTIQLPRDVAERLVPLFNWAPLVLPGALTMVFLFWRSVPMGSFVVAVWLGMFAFTAPYGMLSRDLYKGPPERADHLLETVRWLAYTPVDRTDASHLNRNAAGVNPAYDYVAGDVSSLDMSTISAAKLEGLGWAFAMAMSSNECLAVRIHRPNREVEAEVLYGRLPSGTPCSGDNVKPEFTPSRSYYIWDEQQ